jgi:hypothetical protein
VTVPEITDEYAFITESITEQEMKEKKELLDGVVSIIRVRF